MPCVCLPYNEKALDNHFFLFLIFPHKTETVVHILLPLRTSLNKYYYKSIKMESTKMNEALIANHALPTTMNETLIANSALQATGMKDDDGFLSTLDVRKEMLSFSLQLGLLHRLCLLSLSSGSNECIFSLSSSSSVVSIKHTNKRKENKFQFNSTTEGTKKRTMTTRKVIQYLYGNADLSDRIGTTITCILILSLISTTIMDGE